MFIEIISVSKKTEQDMLPDREDELRLSLAKYGYSLKAIKKTIMHPTLINAELSNIAKSDDKPDVVIIANALRTKDDRSFKKYFVETVAAAERAENEPVPKDYWKKRRKAVAEAKANGATTQELEALSDAIKVDVTDDELKKLGLTFDSTLEVSDIEIYTRLDLGYTASDVDPIKLDDLSDEQLAHFGIARDGSGRYSITSPSDDVLMSADKNRGETVYFSDLDSDGFSAFNDMKTDSWGNPNYTISTENTVMLNTLSDAQLAQLGVSESGDVLKFNGKVCFRYYVAEIDDYYDVDSRSLSVDLLN